MKTTRIKGYRHVTERDYEDIKTLQKMGVRQSQVVRTTKRSPSTISLMYTTNTFAEYKNKAKYRPKKVEKVAEQQELVAVNTIREAIRQAKETGAILITTHAAFVGFDDMYDFVKEASDNEVTVTFAPMGKR